MNPKWRGYYKALALYLLSSRPLSGYEIIRTIEGVFRGKVRPSPGTIYPLLRYLEEEGYIEASEQFVGKRRKRIYRITEKGKALLQQYMSDAAFINIVQYLGQGIGDQVDILDSMIEEISFLAEIFDELDNTSAEKLKRLYAALEEFRRRVARRLGKT
ncbi:MAG: helix-turn-helix transcriptional regulator [Thermoproteus sp. AZ2]|jgi:DNA-binding PadR family transcriptional regulator|uniref:Helix-turn-helix transcriptional regulator n=1 Tax=Thermoproteus sp. AZ2 TaxID=1609232 RepID=A0ACC6UYF9_9CREN|nr:MAG: PadR family transcriptional regulator [Thermoproteus sp. AZ2]